MESMNTGAEISSVPVALLMETLEVIRSNPNELLLKAAAITNMIT